MANNEESEEHFQCLEHKGNLKWIDSYEQGRPEHANEEYLTHHNFNDRIPNIHVAYNLHNRRARNRIYITVGVAILAIIVVCWLINNLT
jgi:hypothetical protein